MNVMRQAAIFQGHFVLATLLVSAALLLSIQGARAEMWCRRDAGRDNPVCVFGSAQDCVRAAAMMGGICEREKLEPTRPRKPCTPAEARSARKHRAEVCG